MISRVTGLSMTKYSMPVRKRTKNKKVFIIAEAGVNHNGRLKLAKKMIIAAKEAGADAVKFQTFKAERLVTETAPKALYQKRADSKKESQLRMLRKLEFNPDACSQLFDYCKKNKILFLSSPFDLESIKLLHNLGVKIFKIPSGEITNLPYLRKVGSLKKSIILSTGMANLKEIKSALRILEESGTLKERITVLHCNTEYPSPFKDVNLLAMLTIRDALGVKVGYSDHTLGIEVPIAATALGAIVIEKHFTLDKNMEGPDHKVSLEPDELRLMVEAIRNVGKALGDGIKKTSFSEFKNKSLMRKSIGALKAIKKGEIFNEDNLITLRPATGISPLKWDRVIGRIAKQDFRKGQLIKL